jgi:hypothetical protein
VTISPSNSHEPTSHAPAAATVARCVTRAIRAYAGRGSAAIGYAEAAVALQADPHYDPFDVGWSVGD